MFYQHIPVDVCFFHNSFQTIIKLKERVMLNGKQIKVIQSLFFSTHFFKIIVLGLIHIHILKMDFSAIKLSINIGSGQDRVKFCSSWERHG